MVKRDHRIKVENMQKWLWRFVALTGIMLLGNETSMCGELRTPIGLGDGSIHYQTLKGKKRPKGQRKRSEVDFEGWAGVYHKASQKAYTKHGFGADPLANLFFGKSTFRLSEALADAGKVNQATGCIASSEFVDFGRNPLIALSKISPRIKYDEHGVIVGFNLEHRFQRTAYRVGLRSSVPFRSIKVENVSCCENIGDTTIDDIRAQQREQLVDAAPIQETIIYRLDFLTVIRKMRFPASQATRALLYADQAPARLNHVTFDDRDLTTPSITNLINNQGVSLIKSDNQTIPTGAFGATTAQVAAASTLQGNGSGLSDGQRGKFSPGINYATGGLACDQDAQAKLWMAPTYTNDGQTKAAEATAVEAIAETVIRSMNDTIVDYLEENDVSLDTQCTDGIGDVDLEAYVGYDFSTAAYLEALIGVRFPTARSVEDPKKVLKLSAGNNGHFEIKLGLDVGGQYNWFAIKADSSYSFVLRDVEKRAATFTGATIKGIGPTVEASLAWEYYLGHLDFTFYHPKNRNLGFNVGYELYLKRHDRARFLKKTAVDFLGQTKDLDPRILEKRTSVISHKARGEIFTYIKHWHFFAGGTYVFAGRNAPRETDLHLGFGLTF